MSRVWNKEKKSESPKGFKLMTPGRHSIHLSYGELMEGEAIYWVHTRVLYTASISIVTVALFGERIKDCKF